MGRLSCRLGPLSIEGLHFYRNVGGSLVSTGVLGLWPWVVAEERQPEPSEEAQKRLVGAVRQLLLGRGGQPRRQSAGQLWAELLICHEL